MLDHSNKGLEEMRSLLEVHAIRLELRRELIALAPQTLGGGLDVSLAAEGAFDKFFAVSTVIALVGYQAKNESNNSR